MWLSILLVLSSEVVCAIEMSVHDQNRIDNLELQLESIKNKMDFLIQLSERQTVELNRKEEKIQSHEALIEQLSDLCELLQHDLDLKEKRIQSLEDGFPGKASPRKDNVQETKVESAYSSLNTETNEADLQQNTTISKSERKGRFTSLLFRSDETYERQRKVWNKFHRKRLLMPKTDSHPSTVAFYAHMSHDENNPVSRQTLIFDIVKTNVGGGYSNSNGVFTAPSDGVYYFTWTVFVYCHDFILTDIARNGEIMGGIISDSDEVCDNDGSSGSVIISLNAGDRVNIQTSQTHGDIFSHSGIETSFSGFKLN